MSLNLAAPSQTAPGTATDGTWLECIACGEQFAPFSAIRYTCDSCDGLLEVRYAEPPSFEDFGASEAPDSGVWRYRAGLPFDEGVSLPEGGTPLHHVPQIEEAVGIETLRINTRG
jgi:Threonine synthase